MSPIYEYKCPDGHVHELLRRYDERDRKSNCPECRKRATRIISAHHQATDGIYSHAPNVGDPKTFERRTVEADERADRTGTYKPGRKGRAS